MKKIFLGTAIALSVLAGCSDMEEQTGNSVPSGTLRASFEQGAKNSRLAMDDNHALSWTSGDAFRMFDVNGNGYAWTLEGEGGTTGIFGGIIPVFEIRGAVYPDAETTTLNDGQLTMTLASSLAYEANGKCTLPMWASFSSLEGAVAFNHLGALLQLNVADIPQGYNSLTVTADRPLAGKFVANLNVENPVLVALEDVSNSVTVSFTAIEEGEESSRVFYVPLPVGNYSSIKVSISDGTNTLSIANWSNRDVVRAHVYVASPTVKVIDTTEPSGVSEELTTLSEEIPSVQVTMTEPIVATAETSIEIPVVENTSTNVQLNFEATPETTQETPLVVEEKQNTEGGEEDGTTPAAITNEVSISLPKATEASQETHMTINTPKSTVNLEGGKFGKIVASTAQNTLKIGDGTEIEDLIIKKGNVRVSVGGKITGSIEYIGEGTMYLILEYGVDYGTDVTENLIGNIQVIRGFNNKEFSYALHDVLGGSMVILDENGYAMMTQENIDAVTELDFGWSNYSITSLSGIEYFTNLESLTCSDVGLAMCDLSQNTKLTYANIQQNQMQTLDFSHCPNLHTLVCSYNQYLVNLNLDGCTQLSNLQAQSTGLTTLDIPNPSAMSNFLYGGTSLSYDLSKFTNLTGLGLMDMNLTDLDLIPSQIKAQLDNLFVDNNQLTSFDFSEFPSLSYLHISYNRLTSLDLSVIPNPEELVDLICTGNFLTALDITPLPHLDRIYCGQQQNGIVLQLTATAAQETTWNETWVHANGSDSNARVEVNGKSKTTIIENIELSTALQGILGADKVTINEDGYAVMSLDDINAITNLDFGMGQYTITSLSGIEKFKNLEELVCNATGLIDCDLSENIALKKINLGFSQFTALDLNANTNLEFIYLSGCRKMTSLNIANCSKLKYLYINSCPAVASFEVPNKSNLLALSYSETKLKFTVSEFPNLLELNCAMNGLMELDITSLTNLQYLSCGNQGVLSGMNISLVLKLTEAQKVMWKSTWSTDPSNKDVRIFGEEVEDGLAGGTGFGNGGKF